MSNVIPPNSSTSTPLQAWVEKLLAYMLLCYGKRFTDQWCMTDSDELVNAWADGLTGLSHDDLKRGKDSLRSRAWPPTLPEFVALCQPYLDPVVAYHEACLQGPRRERGEEEHWSHPAIYWAWVGIGAHALTHQSYEQLKKRWEEALMRHASDPALLPVPARAIALPSPGATRLQPERAKTLLGKLKVRSVEAGPSGDGRGWARAVLDKAAAGKPVSIAAYEMAEQALGLR
jgi:hypothetical protein